VPWQIRMMLNEMVLLYILYKVTFNCFNHIFFKKDIFGYVILPLFQKSHKNVSYIMMIR
jgi:hypothetical protein